MLNNHDQDQTIERVIITLRWKHHLELNFDNILRSLEFPALELDREFVPVLLDNRDEAFSFNVDDELAIVCGTIKKNNISRLRDRRNVVRVDKDVQIAPFSGSSTQPCDCNNNSLGSLQDVARFLQVNKIWDLGYKGQNVVIGIVDGGVNKKIISRAIDGWPNNWGEVSEWGEHGNMASIDALGMAPEASIYDIRIFQIGGRPPDLISNAITGFKWAIKQFRESKTPQILSNSWGIYQEEWDTAYANEPDHPFTKVVIEAIREGIIVLFAAGNCGLACPLARCGQDRGPGRSIWGANGYQEVMTIGAVNLQGVYVGYSSEGPAALYDKKPDFCGVTHFTGYFTVDTGTSAATPIVAGIISLIKQAYPNTTQNEIITALSNTATGRGKWNPQTGWGIVCAKEAFDTFS